MRISNFSCGRSPTRSSGSRRPWPIRPCRSLSTVAGIPGPDATIRKGVTVAIRGWRAVERPRSRGRIAGVERVGSAVVLIPLFVWVTTGARRGLQLLVIAAERRGLRGAGADVRAHGTADQHLAQRRCRCRAHRQLRPRASTRGSATTARPCDGCLPPSRARPRPRADLQRAALDLGAPAGRVDGRTRFRPVYVGWLLGYASASGPRDGPQLVLFLVGVTWAGESAAYLVAPRSVVTSWPPAPEPAQDPRGRRRSDHRVSRRGAGARSLAPARVVSLGAGAGALLGVIGQVATSPSRRSSGASEPRPGGLIPGHGGHARPIDSLLFNAPALTSIRYTPGAAHEKSITLLGATGSIGLRNPDLVSSFPRGVLGGGLAARGRTSSGSRRCARSIRRAPVALLARTRATSWRACFRRARSFLAGSRRLVALARDVKADIVVSALGRGAGCSDHGRISAGGRRARNKRPCDGRPPETRRRGRAA